MALFNSIRLGASAGGDYEVERSVRNDQGSSDVNSGSNFSRTFSSGNRKIFTVSVWVKKCNTAGNIGDDQYSIFSTGGGGSGASQGNFYFNNDDTLYFVSTPQPSTNLRLITTRKFRDFSAWYHLVVAVDTTQGTASNRAKLYVNGIQETSLSTATYPSQNDDLYYNLNTNHRIGSNSLGSNLNSTYGNFNGYIAEFNFIDGLQLDPSSFGKTDAITGQWNPKKYTGSYGTNGFYLNFSDNSGTTATTLGKDSSGNGNNFTPNNFVTGDSVKDSPTNNFATLMIAGTPKASGCSLKEGNLEFETGTTGSGGNGNRLPFNTISPTSGKWYVEVMPTTTDSIFIGVHTYQVEILPTSGATRWQGLYSYNGESYLASTSSTASNSTYAASYGNNDVIGIYMDMDASPPQVYFAKNGQWANGSGSWNQSTPTGAITLGGTFFTTSTGGFEGIGINIRSASSSTNTSAQANFGQDSTFSGRISAGGNVDASGIGDFKYAVPTGAKALCSANLPDPTILLPNKHFDTLLWTGTSASHTLTGLNFQPDWFWAKSRSQAHHNTLMDSVRGSDRQLWSNRTNDEQTDANFLTSFNSNGVTLGDNSSGTGATNVNGHTYVGWNWNAGGSTVTNNDGSISSQVRANTSAGFSIVGYTGINGAGTIGHGLGVAPRAVIIRRRDSASDWAVFHAEVGNTKRLVLNSTAAESSANSSFFNNTSPTSTTISLGSDAGTGGSTDNYIVYAFSEVAGYSKFGSYTGNGSSDGTFVFTGFRPAFIITKRSQGGTSNWYIWDSKRELNVINSPLQANDAGAEPANYDNSLDILSNGFKLRATNAGTNGSGDDYIYLAFAESPFKNSRAR